MLQISLKFSDSSIQSRFITSFGNIANIVDTPNTTRQGFVVSERCPDVHEIFAQENHLILFKNNNVWLFVDDLSLADEILVNHYNRIKVQAYAGR